MITEKTGFSFLHDHDPQVHDGGADAQISFSLKRQVTMEDRRIEAMRNSVRLFVDLTLEVLLQCIWLCSCKSSEALQKGNSFP